MQEAIDSIIERINFKRKEEFLKLLLKCIHVSTDTTKSTYAIHDNIVFKLDVFFKGFSSFQNELGKDKKYESGVEALSVICEELGIEIEKSECFIFYHMKDLGKFRKKESDLHEELKVLWKQYKHYSLLDIDFSYALKNLMRMRFIDYRRGSIYLNKSVVIRYRTRES